MACTDNVHEFVFGVIVTFEQRSDDLGGKNVDVSATHLLSAQEMYVICGCKVPTENSFVGTFFLSGKSAFPSGDGLYASRPAVFTNSRGVYA